MTIKRLAAPAMLKAHDTLEWLVEKGSIVNAGDVLARTQPEKGRSKGIVEIVSHFSGTLSDSSPVVVHYSGRGTITSNAAGRFKKKRRQKMTYADRYVTMDPKTISGRLVANVKIHSASTAYFNRNHNYNVAKSTYSAWHKVFTGVNTVFVDNNSKNKTEYTGSDPFIQGFFGVPQTEKLPMRPEKQSKLQDAFDKLSSQYASLHAESEKLINEYDSLETEVDADLERRKKRFELYR